MNPTISSHRTARRLPDARLRRLAIIVCLLLALSGCEAASHLFGGAALVSEGATTADLRARALTEEQLAELAQYTQLVALDIRDNAVSIKQFEALQKALPGCEILWSVPIGDATFDSAATTLVLPNVDASQIQALRYFPHLANVDATQCTCYDALVALQNELPACTFLWNVSVGGKTVSNSETVLDLSGTDITAEALAAALPYLPALTGVDLHDTGISAEKLLSLGSAYPSIRFDACLDVCGKSVDTSATSIDLSDASDFDAQALCDALAYLPDVESVNLTGLSVSLAELDTLRAAYPELVLEMELELAGIPVAMTDTTLDLSGRTIEDLDEFAGTLKYLPKLASVNMVDCGVSDERMGALCEQFPNIQFIWYVTVGRWLVRTDSTGFSTGNEHSTDTVQYLKSGVTNLTTEDIAGLKYCTELVALDIGHKRRITDISVVASMPKLRFLIVAMEGITDISPVAACTELEYLETFQNNLTDLSPLLTLKKLTHLNCSTNAIGSIDVLKQMTQLQRLWCIRCNLDKEQIAELQAALPECVINTTGTHSTSNGWRKNDLYKEMQRAFGLTALE